MLARYPEPPVPPTGAASGAARDSRFSSGPQRRGSERGDTYAMTSSGILGGGTSGRIVSRRRDGQSHRRRTAGVEDRRPTPSLALSSSSSPSLLLHSFLEVACTFPASGYLPSARFRVSLNGESTYYNFKKIAYCKVENDSNCSA